MFLSSLKTGSNQPQIELIDAMFTRSSKVLQTLNQYCRKNNYDKVPVAEEVRSLSKKIPSSSISDTKCIALMARSTSKSVNILKSELVSTIDCLK